jgi:hypothetical protein
MRLLCVDCWSQSLSKLLDPGSEGRALHDATERNRVTSTSNKGLTVPRNLDEGPADDQASLTAAQPASAIGHLVRLCRR